MRCFCPLNTWSVSMETNKCKSCFYIAMDKDLEAPCAVCTGYSNWVPIEMFEEGTRDYDVVSKPKHYMLFEDEGIEVRDVIRKLVNKIDANFSPYDGLFVADYVQLLQYLMRFMEKNGLEDLKKAQWYLTQMIEAYESDV